MARIKVRLPRLDRHIPADKKLPDGLGLPVLVNYVGDPIGEVVGWTDRGDGTAEAELEVELPDLGTDDLAFGFWGMAQQQHDGDQVVVLHIDRIKCVGVWPAGSRGHSEYGDDLPDG